MSKDKPAVSRPAPSALQTQSYPVLLSEVKLIDGTNANLTWKENEELETSNDNAMEYEVSWWTDETDKRSAITRSTEYLVTKLKPGLKYSAHVVICKYKNDFEPMPSNTVVFDTAPMKPVDVKVESFDSSSHDSINISFKNENTKGVDHEIVVRKLTGEGDDIRHRTKGMQSFIVSDLVPGESYSLYVRTTYLDLNQWSLKTFYDGIIQTHPAKPQHVELVYQNGEMHLTWTPLEIKPICYKVFYETNNGASSKQESIETPDHFFRLSCLTPATTYRFRVAAVNKAGIGEKSEQKEKVTAPSAPVNIQVKPNRLAPHTSFVVKYEDTDTCKKQYEVVAVGRDGKVAAKVLTEACQTEIHELQAGQSYNIHVTAIYCDLRSAPAYVIRF